MAKGLMLLGLVSVVLGMICLARAIQLWFQDRSFTRINRAPGIEYRTFWARSGHWCRIGEDTDSF